MVAGPSTSIERKRAVDITRGLPRSSAEKPSVQSERRSRVKRKTTPPNATSAKSKRRRIAESSDDGFDDTADETRIRTTSIANKAGTTPTAPETRAQEIEGPLDETSTATPEMRASDNTATRQSTRPRKAVKKKTLT